MNDEYIISEYIDDLNLGKKPRILDNIGELDDDMLDLVATVRAVKRTCDYTKRKTGSKKWSMSRLLAVGIAAILVFILTVGIEPYLSPNKGNIVYAVVRAYEQLNSYQGEVVINSFENGELTFSEQINVSYQKPWKYNAIHKFDENIVKRISDGTKVMTVYHDMVEIDNLFPEKYLWNYHIGTTVWELEKATEVRQLGIEKVIGRDAYLIEYKVSQDANYYKMWVDIETDLPLKKELTFSENRKIIVEFKSIDVNLNIDEKNFVVEMPRNKNIKEWNQISSFKSVTAQWPWTKKLAQVLPNDLELIKVGKEDETSYVLRYKSNEKEFLDVVITPKPDAIRYLGNENKGFVQIKEGVVNAFKVHIGQTNLAQWVTQDQEVFFITTKSSGFLLELLNKLVEKGTEFNI